MCTSGCIDLCTTYLDRGAISYDGEWTTVPISLLMPRLHISWDKNDLSEFTPASAPLIVQSARTWYKTLGAPAQATSSSQTSHLSPSNSREAKTASKTMSSTPTKSNDSGIAHYTHKPSPGLSTGAKAGIGVGVVVAVLAIIAAAAFYFRRGTRASRMSHSSRLKHWSLGRKSSSKAYVDGKPELDGTTHTWEKSELPESGPQPQEVAATTRQPPPVPLASKPRFAGRSELDGGFSGHEMGNAPAARELG
jgi:hypothetical protein